MPTRRHVASFNCSCPRNSWRRLPNSSTWCCWGISLALSKGGLMRGTSPGYSPLAGIGRETLKCTKCVFLLLCGADYTAKDLLAEWRKVHEIATPCTKDWFIAQFANACRLGRERHRAFQPGRSRPQASPTNLNRRTDPEPGSACACRAHTRPRSVIGFSAMS